MKNKKILALLLAGVMVSSIPFNVFADETAEVTSTSETKVTEPAKPGEETEAPVEGEETEAPVEPTEETGEGEKDQETDPKEGEETTCKVTFKDGSKEEVFEGVEKNKVLPNNKKPSDPKKDGFTFLGWYKDGKKLESTTVITGDTTFEAAWKENEVEKITVTFKNEETVVKTETVEKGNKVEKPANPTKKGYKFLGWYDGSTNVTFPYEVKKDVTLTAKWEKIEEEKPVVPAKEDLYISDIEYDGDYVTGKVTSKGVAVDGATVTLKIDGYKTSYKDTTDSYGRFKVYLGKYYDDYRYYYDDYYYRDGYRYYDGYRVYSDSDGWYYYKNGRKHYINYSSRYYRWGRDYKADLIAEKTGYYSAEKNLWEDGYYYNNGRYYGRDWYNNKYDYKVYPTDVDRTNYSTSGYLKGYKNRTVYVYDDGTYLGSDTIDSDGYFKVTWNSPRVSTSRTLDYYVNGKYVNDSGYSIIPTVNTVYAGAKYLRGNAGDNASVTVYDSNGVKLGSTTAGSTGIYNVTLNRALRAGETIKVEAKESGKIARSTEYKVGGVSTNVEAKVNQPSYIAGYPDGTFKPGREVTRAEAVRMFVKLVNNGAELPKNPTTKFKDANNKWYSDEINYAVSKGFIKGYSDGTFKPNQTITRAEFAQMISVFVKDGYPGSSNFKDVKGHWASDAINELYGNKNIKGFPDGTFKPNQKLTRAEAVTILNSVFGRNTKSTSFANVSESGLKKFSDVSKSHWAYYEILDASNGHNAVKGDKSDDVSVWQ